MKKRSNGIVVCIFFLFFFSCKEGRNEQIQFKTYETNNIEWQSKSSIQLLGDYSYQVTEVPLQYYLLKNNESKPTSIDSIFNAHKKERIIEVEFSHIDRYDLLEPEYNTKKSYQEAVGYMAFSIRGDFTAITSSNDTIQCNGVHFERNFNVAPYKKILLYFNGVPPEEDLQLVYQDHLFGKGTIKFSLKKEPVKL